jgi:NAD(P)-dependent dehydrogenase (short-subunit alcohol dehydrogenase family)
MRVWFVTGASRGLGAEIVREALDRGHRVTATARDAGAVRRLFGDKPDSLLIADLDVTDERQIHAAVEATLHRFGRIDVLVNNAGWGLVAAIEEATDAAARAIFDTNVFGVLNMLRAVLPTLRAQRSGYVINIGSIGGFNGYPGWGMYNATKFALEGLTEALHAELTPLGIDVTIVEPGGFRTDFLDVSSLHVEPDAIADYASSAGETRGVPAAFNHAQRGDPAKLAGAILDLAETMGRPLRLQLGPDAVEGVEAKLSSMRRELEQWRAVALSTDYDVDQPAD